MLEDVPSQLCINTECSTVTNYKIIDRKKFQLDKMVHKYVESLSPINILKIV